MKLLKEFKEFAVKGNMFDMAIGIIIGMAFNKIVNALVNEMILPFFSLFTGTVNFQNLKLILKPKETNLLGETTQEMVSINYGNFLQMVLEFLIIAFTIFLVIKIFNKLRKKAEDTSDNTISTPKDIELLSEIRDLLKANK